MKNQVIEVLNEEHGKKVIQYWKDRGVDTLDFTGMCTMEVGDTFRYYGVINEYFDNYSMEHVKSYNAEIITLPEPEVEWKPKFGERVLVWDYAESQASVRIFLNYEKGTTKPVHVVRVLDVPKFAEGKPYAVAKYQNMKPLPKVKEVTMQEIADKFGVPVEQLKIKK